MAHIGLTPQAVNALGGYAVRGRTEAEAMAIMADAEAVADAGDMLCDPGAGLCPIVWFAAAANGLG
jgi:hypothetical protein